MFVAWRRVGANFTTSARVRVPTGTERLAIHGKTLAARQPTSHSTAAAAENHFPQGETEESALFDVELIGLAAARIGHLDPAQAILAAGKSHGHRIESRQHGMGDRVG